MKNKFDILYESIMNQLKNAEVDYELVSDFKKNAKNKLKDATDENVSTIIKQIKKSIEWNDPSKADKLNQLKKLCQKKFDQKIIKKLFK